MGGGPIEREERRKKRREKKDNIGKWVSLLCGSQSVLNNY